ncbi:Hypothetical predicted protein, partial [Paramuricea clavata]
TLRFKQIFQELCESKVDWDEPLNDEFCEEWNQIVQKLKEANHMSIPRCYCPDSFGNLDSTVGQLTCGEIDSAELKWIKDIQYPMSKQANYRKVKESLNLFEDKENIIRCHGRIQESPLPYDTKFPILLASDHYFARLFVLRSHEQVMHNGVRETLTQVQSKY